ncbi:hypothetical protein VTL71DRAFT_9253, partial [Oculimacula yallundae]
MGALSISSSSCSGILTTSSSITVSNSPTFTGLYRHDPWTSNISRASGKLDWTQVGDAKVLKMRSLDRDLPWSPNSTPSLIQDS